MAKPVDAADRNIVDVFLRPGSYCVGGADHRIRTLLGSCVSIILWHPQRRVGAMSHFMLPSRPRPSTELDGHYGEDAMWLMLRDLVRDKTNPLECQAKIFGGGNMFPEQTRLAVPSIGEKNGATARQLLKAYGIPIVCEDLFGIGHRQLHFNVRTGDVFVRKVGVMPPR
jgi:chemotaxis protein CheD